VTCYRPLTAFKPLDGGPVSFSEKKAHREIQLPCGQCIGCRIRKREEWAIRCYCESKMHQDNVFLTLTYDDEHVPSDGSLDYRHFQLFMKRARKKFGPFRFFMCGEYGETTQRPHYHALLFGLAVPDRVKSNSVYAKSDVYDSETIRSLWGQGNISLGEVTYASARYCAVYATKKITGARAAEHYQRVNPYTGELHVISPEFAHMSLRPGIGLGWLRRYWPDLYASDAGGMVIDGKVKCIPRYFDTHMEVIANEVLESHQFKRFQAAMSNSENHTPERLRVREACAQAKERFNKERNNALQGL